MAHQSLYRKYRPQTFDDIVGQRHITRTLRNAVGEGAVAHAYLFTGPRGTGKTTTARILAKALLCENGPTPTPDVTCQQCVDVAENRHPDVYELDAATRTQVEVVREEIINRLQYAATRGGWKVYIIDEVHMLSMHSFNALLKSIEEPPPRTVFLLCTTHPHKVPDTIHSRCQRFDFHRIGMDDIVGRLNHICAEENIAVAEGALTLVAKHAGGGMRDAITTLEQLASFTGKNIALDDVEGLLGEVDVAQLVELATLVAARDIAGCFGFVARLSESGADMGEFVRDFTGHVRDLFVTSAVGDPTGIVDASSEQLSRLGNQASRFGMTRLQRMLDLLGELAAEMRWSSDPRLSLEVALTRMARPDADLTIESLAERIEALESGMPLRAGAPVTAPAPEKSPPAEEPETARAAAVPTDPEPAVPADAPPATTPTENVAATPAPLDRGHVKRGWPAVMAEVRRLKSSRAHIFDNTEVDVDPATATLVIEFPADQKFTLDLASEPDTRELMAQAIARVFGVTVFRYQLGRGAVQSPAAQPAPGPAPELAPAAQSAPEAESAAQPAPEAAPEPEAAAAGDVDERAVEQMLMSQLGATVIAEHPHDTDDREGT